MPLTPLPPLDPLDPAGDYSRAQAWEMIESQYTNAGNYAQWAHSTLQSLTDTLADVFTSDVVTANIEALLAILNQMPDPTILFTDDGFTGTLLTSLESRLSTDLTTNSTGLGTAEAALFARETARQNAARSAAYTELTTQYSSRGFDMPPGALLAKQTEVNNQSALLLTDSSSQIMAESARLAVDYNKHVLQSAASLIDLLGRLYDSKTLRDFEKAKTEVAINVENLKVRVSLLSDASRLELDAALRTSTAQIETLKGLSLASMQLIASAMNTVSAGSNFSFSGSASTNYDGT